MKHVRLRRRKHNDGWKVLYTDKYGTHVTPYPCFSGALCAYLQLRWQSIWQKHR